MTLWAIVPVKSIDQGKTRLAGILSDEERASLNITMLTNLLQTLHSSEFITGVVVVSHDPEVKELTNQFSFSYLEEDQPFSLNFAVESACKFCIDLGASEVIILPADLPLLNSNSLNSLLEKDFNPPIAIIAPDRRKEGTNSILINPLNGFSFNFGENSFSKHQQIAFDHHYRVEIFHNPAFELDLDTPEDWISYQELSNQQIKSSGG